MDVWNYYKHVNGTIHEIQTVALYEAGQPFKSEPPLVAITGTAWGKIFDGISKCRVEVGMLENPVPVNEAMAYYVIDDETCVKEHTKFEDISMLPKDQFDDAGEYDALVKVMNDYPFYKHVDGKIHFAYQTKNNEHLKPDITELEKYHDKAEYKEMFEAIL